MGATIFIVLTLFIYYRYTLSTRNAVERLIVEKKMINIMLSFQGNKNKKPKTFFLLASINPDNNNVGLTILPPNLRVRLDNDGKRFGELNKLDYNNFTKTQVIRTLEKELKIVVPFYVDFTNSNIIRLIDLIEGVNIFHLDQQKLDVKKHFGLQYFDGKKVIKYIHDSSSNSIYIKYGRLLDILLTLYSEKKIYRQLRNMMFLKEAFQDVLTNLLPQELYKIFELLSKNGNLYTTILPGNINGNYYVVDNIAYKLYENKFLSSLVLNKIVIPKVQILNGTGVPRLARKMRLSLIRDGLNIVEFGTSTYPRMKHSIVICRNSNTSSAKKVSDIAGITKIYYINDNTTLSNVLIIIGEDRIL